VKQPPESSRATLSPRDLGRALGVSESSVKRWVDSGALTATRTAGGHRRIALAEAVQFIRRSGTPVARPEVLGGARDPDKLVTAGPSASDDVAELLHRELVGDDARAGAGLILSMYLMGWSVPAIFDGPVRAALARIGERWLHDPMGVVVEHRAIDTCLAALAELRALLPPAEPGAPEALGGAPAGDPYLLPSLMAAIVLLDAGYAPRNLGADTPVEALTRAAAHYQPRLVWLTISSEPRPGGELVRHLDALAGTVAPWDGVVVVGGRTLRPLPSIATNVHHLGSMAELAAFARGLGADRQPARSA